MPGIIYLLTNEAMPGLVKIGKTSQDDPMIRLDQLYAPGVPVPFDCVLAMTVENPATVEKALHTAFGPHRINLHRGFFNIEPEQAMAVLRQIGQEDVTSQINEQNDSLTEEERASSAHLRQRHSR